MKLELGMGNGAKKPVKYPTKRTVNLAKRESHSQSVMTLSIGTAVIIGIFTPYYGVGIRCMA